ncbi:MAG: DUF262 domain-containing protein [Acholeplasmataceae bacterium]|nr:DUF262 domain-containing protein [Acholeplasmataceae bacterium]
MALIDEINKMRQEIRTDGYPMSVNEWASLYENDKNKPEIDVHPEFQRYYRWTPEQKSKLIESIFLGIPIPPIFVSQRKDGVWDVVDGLQRLSTIYEFMGILKDEEGKKVKPLVLQKTQYLPSLEGKKWDDEYDIANSLTDEERLLIKRSKISASILLRESDEIAKYELFQRLNTGGSSLTPQEVRNCMLVMTNREMYLWVRALSQYEKFQEVIGLSENPLQEQYDVELALRFIIFHNIDHAELTNLADLGLFITNKMLGMAKNPAFNKSHVESVFKDTFDLLSSSIGRNAFRRFDVGKQKFTGGFLLSPFEVVAYGLGYNYKNFPALNQIEEKVKSVWTEEEFNVNSGTGIPATRRLPRLLPIGRRIFVK